ncbi:T9SS type A sorting domain-containing protein [Saccharicrinis fermentans]|uniref:Putative dienelactone hydrolase n=1 Tax=Saccharicrinis fermentans DSM 9555 = JCM 21142 TaxID=869213 RepID=W7Y198_9BACT|nr:T9SS type A sorting domain-containing protein [Saccharicrinis fermentans]GAF01722.1 putative dienelactone hydrolase [Saccharicrinis fermentans DSM 9555 = JCM 21142]
MKSIFCLFAWGVLNVLTVFGQSYTGPIQKPTSGYGAEGSYAVAIQSFPNPNFLGHDIVIYYPEGITSSVPTLFYSHAYGGNNPANISGFLNFVAKKGYAVVFVPYPTVGATVGERYANLLDGFIQAAHDYPDIIDTTKVGFVGHSFGGGAVYANAYYCFATLNWGLSGRFIFSMAQWYTFHISQTELEAFPKDVKFLAIVYEDDVSNDHRMTNDIFTTIGIPSSEKDYLMIPSANIGGYDYAADHQVPNNTAFDALDYYAYYRLLDAMCDYVFNGNEEAKDVALGNGSENQITMPEGMPDLIQSDVPNFANEQSTYLFPCDSHNNPRQAHCDAVISVSTSVKNTHISLTPNPANTFFHVETEQIISQIDIFNQQGQLVKSASTKDVSIAELCSGLYFVRVGLVNNHLKVCRLIKE